MCILSLINIIKPCTGIFYSMQHEYDIIGQGFQNLNLTKPKTRVILGIVGSMTK
jgi:hypothetical protein